ncbi:MAG: ChbG/HpnK family deacetylase [Oligoflexia bacterium]|nr:ChbG/HpnK family deacetylase [Oligoflexia bacterium]
MRLCADDYGLNPSVSTGILNLIQKKKINSVSCLTTTDCWKKKASSLKPFFRNIELGLHLSLTEPKPIYSTASSLRALIKKAYLGNLKKQDIIQEIRAQMEMFSKNLGVLPNYIDGHEFCHHLPIVREALIDIAKEFHFKKNNIYIRVFHTGKLPLLKNSIFWLSNRLASFPSKKLITLLKKEGISFNSRLFGFHPYCWDPDKYFDYYFQMKPSKQDIFFCHPGLLSEDSSDPLRYYRFQIYNFMMSSQFDSLLNRYNLSL